MKSLLGFVMVMAFIASVRADQAVADAQQVLKDQGYYYGAVSGTKDADTSAAIRRYQIRNGLEITGELNDETRQSLHKAAAATPTPVAPSAPPPAPARPQPNTQQQQQRPNEQEPDDSDLRDNGAPYAAPPQTAPNDPRSMPVPGVPPQVYPGRVPPQINGGGLFSGTPYEMAPPPVQQKVVIDAQRILARRGLFKGPVDGVYGPDMEFSLRAYQSKVGLASTGRLDLETLAALELLPGAPHERVYTPRRSYPPSPLPPVRGEWVRP